MKALWIVFGLVVLMAVASSVMLAGCRLAGIRRATWPRSAWITFQCLAIQVVVMLITIVPLLGMVVHLIGLFIVPTLVIKTAYHVPVEKAFWAAFGYICIMIALLLTVQFTYVRHLPG